MILERSTPSVEGFAFIVENTMADSFRSEEDKQDTIKRYLDGDCQLWCIQGKGFLIISWHETDGERWMEVEQGCGRFFYSRLNMALVKKLAIQTDCETIECETIKPLVSRLLERIGFKIIVADGNGSTHLTMNLKEPDKCQNLNRVSPVQPLT